MQRGLMQNAVWLGDGGEGRLEIIYYRAVAALLPRLGSLLELLSPAVRSAQTSTTERCSPRSTSPHNPNVWSWPDRRQLSQASILRVRRRWPVRIVGLRLEPKGYVKDCPR